ncbi:helix-turn-helix domain-containing protein [Streptomyces sp. NEAU-PBA10]|uniref:helix-turn-helix domain-containing protein n=1 Tax=Streptomyces TaxID=1883 RepID=UPI001C2EDD34|nr:MULTISPECIES: helix-turn-helix domain-containing protein [unclassified Streptomyces]MBV1953799.1 helix-turn-helix domain-containing protein [Streptomyces sp. BV333]MCG5120210.1 helix-turn-helix domain-containing protein [Streptomyces sp. T7(2022)]UDF07914.1 helix-turn-helix domain-containing protein [Streptomyces sp. WA1-19]UYX93047.1 helix-turn-helix domain-containing protein [Streptomyces sp. BI87]
MHLLFSSDEVAPGEGLAVLDELYTTSEHPMRMLAPAPEKFRATVRSLDLAAVNVVELTASPSEVVRTPRLVRQADPELSSVLVPLRGRVGLGQAGREAVLGPRELALYDSSRPFELRLAPGGEGAALLRAHVPRALLDLPAGRLDRLLGTALDGRAGVGGLLTQFLTGTAAGSAAYSTADLARLGTVALDLLRAVLAHHLDAEDAVPDDSRRRTLLLRIEAFVQRNLHEPQLSPAAIAAAHHISVSHLHRLFEGRDTTVAAWVRRQRLQRARRDLADPALGTVPVHHIAARWGFNDHSTFTRAFRGAYGMPPREYRRSSALR